MLTTKRTIALLFAAILVVPAVQAQSGTVSGFVTDSESGEPLVGANVRIEGTSRGAAADVDGFYTLTNLAPGTYYLAFSYTGFRSATHEVEVLGDDPVQLDVTLMAGVELDQVQVTAGRREEKLLHAPASISVLSGSDVELHAAPTAIKALKNVVGLDYAQTGIDRQEVVLRGFNNVFSGSAHVLTDYRHAGAAVLNVNVHASMPAIPVDLDRVEVVRGPGSALYGAGVGSGVIHYLSKSAVDHPGVTISAAGGQQSMLNFQGRLATRLARNFGVKVVGFYGSAEDFAMEPCDQALLQARAWDQCPDPLDAQQQAFDGGLRDTRMRKAGIRGNAELRIGDNTSIHVDGGFSTVNLVALSGIGTIQADGYLQQFVQLRLNSGPFFAQAYINKNDSQDSFVYNEGSDPVVEKSSQANVQAQYDLHLWDDRQNLIVGVDMELLTPDSDGSVYGRNERDTQILELGGYVQSTTQLGSKFDLVAALRADFHNRVGKVHYSPRAALVYKPTPTNSVRFTYNRSFSNPSATHLFLDLIAAELPGGLKIRGRGAVDGYTWARNPDYLGLGAPSDLVASSLIPGMEGADMPLGMPTGLVYGLFYQGLAAMSDEDLADMLGDALGLSDAVKAALLAFIPLIKDELSPANTEVRGFSAGQLGMLNLTTLGIDPISNDLAPVSQIKSQISQAFEIGYKGLLTENVLLAVDAYYAGSKNFAGGLTMATPFVLVPTLSSDLTRDLAVGIEGNEALKSFLNTMGTLLGLDLSPAAAAAIIVGIAAEDLPSAVGIVQPVENHAGVGNVPELLITYPNFGKINYWGADVAVQVVASEQLSLFGNVSWMSDDYFDHTETGEENPDLTLALNAPTFKFKFGGTWRMRNGFSVLLSGRYQNGFRMQSGTYIGDVKPYFLADLGIGYEIGGGLRADLNISNVANNVHREFIGAPKIGRVGTVRLQYNVGW